MTDYFALLQQPREPWLDAEGLKSQFLSLSSTLHPDRFHAAPEAEKKAAEERYALLSSAYQVLRDPKERLRHFLELERGRRPAEVKDIPAEMVTYFTSVGAACREADLFLTSNAEADSPLLKVERMVGAEQQTEKLQQLLQSIHGQIGRLEETMQSMGAQSTSPEGVAAFPLEQLESIYRVYSFFVRWRRQLEERISQLALLVLG